MKPKAAYFVVAIALLGQAAQNSPFYLPVRNNDLSTLRKLIHDPGPKARDGRGNSPLMYAASLGSPESMRLLLEAGADPNAANDLDATPLMWCAGDAVKVRMLLSKGAKVNVRSKLGRTPLLIAAAYDGATEAARLLIEKGADVNAADKSGISVLEQAANVNNIELARLLLAKGAKVNSVDGGGYTALLGAAGNGDRNAAMVQLLIEHGATANVKSGDTVEIVKNGPIAIGHLTPLHAAANVASYEAVEALVKAGADVNAKDVRNATPLAFAVTTDRPNAKIVELLLSKGAAREPALDWVRRYQNPTILALFGLSPPPIVEPSPNAGPHRSAREAITKALGSSQSSSAKFLAAGGCVSCHAQHLNGMAVAAAKGVGLKTDTALEAEDTRATVALRGAMQEQLFEIQDPPPGVDGMQFSLLQLAAAKATATLATDSLIQHVAAMSAKKGTGQTTGWPGRR